jgi:integrase
MSHNYPYYRKRVPKHLINLFDLTEYKLSLKDIEKKHIVLIKSYLNIAVHNIEKNADNFDKSNITDYLKLAFDKALCELYNLELPTLQSVSLITKSLPANRAFDDFIAYKEDVAKIGKSSIKSYLAARKYFMLFFDETRDLSSFSLDEFERMQRTIQKFPRNTLSKYKEHSVEQLLKVKKEQALSAVQINGIFSILYALFERQVEREVIEKNPLKAIKALKEEEREKNAYTLEDIHLILQSDIAIEIKEISQFAMHTGMRIGEIVMLKVCDIQDELITVNGTKTKNAKRVIPLHDKLKEIVKQRSHHPSEFLFYQEVDPKQTDRVNAIPKKINRVLNTIITDKSKTFHSFRKNFRIQLQLNFPELDKYSNVLLGHSNKNDIGFFTYGKNQTNLNTLVKMVQSVGYEKGE